MSEIVRTADEQPRSDLRLAAFEIVELFGQFNYEIPLNLDEHVTAFIAPNGTGKTLCLRLIAALFSQRWSTFREIEFTKAVYHFNDGSVIEIKKRAAAPVVEPDADFGISLTLKRQRGKNVSWSPRGNTRSKGMPPLDRYLPFLSRIGIDSWRHDQTGDVLTTGDVVDTYGEMLPTKMIDSVYGPCPPEVTDIIQKIDCKLIETQRLLILSDERADSYYSHPKAKSTLAITRKAEKLKDIISKEINAYAALSQSLDRSFPKRVITRAMSEGPADLSRQLAELDDKRLELMEAGILDTETDEPVALPAGPMSPAIASVLTVYADDTRKKLSSLSNLLNKIKLFKKLIDQRFVTKDVNISRKEGIHVKARGNSVPLSKLSSGEQHQLVLFFELLFEIKRNSLILIDEPELSLHVAWQRKFIGDLKGIIDLNKFDVVLATHSPQLIGEWEHLVVELGDVYEGEEPSEISEYDELDWSILAAEAIEGSR